MQQLKEEVLRQFERGLLCPFLTQGSVNHYKPLIITPMSGSYNLTLFELLQLSKVKEKMIQTYRIKSAKWNNELVKPLGNFYVHGITLPTNS